MESSDIQRIEHIKHYCEDITKSIERFGNDFETFRTDKDFYNSVSMGIMQIGELSSRLSDGFKQETKAQIPWGLVRSMRNMFAHDYYSMDKDTVWETATNDILTLLHFCDSIIEQHSKEK